MLRIVFILFSISVSQNYYRSILAHFYCRQFINLVVQGPKKYIFCKSENKQEAYFNQHFLLYYEMLTEQNVHLMY